jgi:hypothetical protein
MQISPGKSNSNAATLGKAAAQRMLVKILHRTISGRGLLLAALLAGVVSLPLAATAQDERPQITPGERKAPRKKEAGPRALAVLQLGANGKASLVPVAILVNGKFWDATAYKADPVPMALESGTVYEAARAGSSLGLFTVNSALHSNAANTQNPWLGTGNWVPTGSEVKNDIPKAESVPAGMDSADQPPRLTRNPKETPAVPPAQPTSNAPPSTAPSSSGDEPPRLTKSTPPPSAPQKESTQSGQVQPDATKSTTGDSKPADNKADRPKGPESDSGATDANRPTLRRGKPVGPLPDDDVPGYSKPGAVASVSGASTANGNAAAGVAADKSSVQLIPAISDAAGPEPKSFAFEWLKDEEGERRQQMVTLATEQVRAYVQARAKASAIPKPKSPGSTAAARRTVAPKVKDPILENVHMTAYDLWANNQPVMVLSADAHMPPPPAGAPHSEVDSDLQYSIVLVAYPDIYNNLHKIFAGVTDKYHLDMTPRLELVDAVDVDGDRRGELLFREVSDGASGWIIYRPTPDKLWKMYDSLHPE